MGKKSQRSKAQSKAKAVADLPAGRTAPNVKGGATPKLYEAACKGTHFTELNTTTPKIGA